MSISASADRSLFAIMEGKVKIDEPFHGRTTLTSKKARAMVRLKEGSQAWIILDFIRSRGERGASDFEGIGALAGQIMTVANSYRRARLQLLKLGKIRLADFTRKSPSGCDCEVWVAAEELA